MGQQEGGCLRPASDFPFLLPLAYWGSFLAREAGCWLLVAAEPALPLLTFGDSGKRRFGPRERVLSWAGRAWPRATKLLRADRTFLISDSGLAAVQRRVRPWHCQRAHSQRGGTLWKAQGAMGPP